MCSPYTQAHYPHDTSFMDERHTAFTQTVLDQLGAFLGITFMVVCALRTDKGHLVFHVQDVRSMQTATVDPTSSLTIGNIHQPHLRPAEMMLDINGLTVNGLRELAGVFVRQLTPENTPEHLHEVLFDSERLLAQRSSVTVQPNPAALLHVHSA